MHGAVRRLLAKHCPETAQVQLCAHHPVRKPGLGNNQGAQPAEKGPFLEDSPPAMLVFSCALNGPPIGIHPDRTHRWPTTLTQLLTVRSNSTNAVKNLWERMRCCCLTHTHTHTHTHTCSTHTHTHTTLVQLQNSPWLHMLHVCEVCEGTIKADKKGWDRAQLQIQRPGTGSLPQKKIKRPWGGRSTGAMFVLAKGNVSLLLHHSRATLLPTTLCT